LPAPARDPAIIDPGISPAGRPAPRRSAASARADSLRASGIRKILSRAATMPEAVNLTIGQPDFPVPDAVRIAAIDAINAGRNGYTPNAGDAHLLRRINEFLAFDVGWNCKPAGTTGHAGPLSMVTTGTSGGLSLAFLSMLDPGDECIIPDPYFVSYPELATICNATAVACETGEDGLLTAERVEPLITDRTRFVLFSTPSNPGGVVSPKRVCDDLTDLCRSKGLVLISDEIYDAFTFPDARTDHRSGDASARCCPSPARRAGAEDTVLLIRGFGKTYGCTGWRMGYAAGPVWLLEAMSKFQQYVFVCAPTPLQLGAAACFDADMDPIVLDYQMRRDMIVNTLGPLAHIAPPGGAFYAWIRVPEHLGMTGAEFTELAASHGVLVVPGGVFSRHDTHFRISYATDPARLARGLDILAGLMRR
jgi:aspartate/methionine/tyrosine aminotransferase